MINNHDLKKAICPNCVSEVRVDVLFEEKTSWSGENVDGSDRYWTLRCRGCDNIFFGHGRTFSEDTDEQYDQESRQWYFAPVERIVYYPRALKRKKPDWFNLDFSFDRFLIGSTLTEVYSALDHGLLVIGTTGIRTVFDLISLELKIDPALSFKDKIENLRANQHITGRERDYLQLLVDAGGAAAHAGWQPSSDQVTTLIEILEGLIHRSLILPKKADDLKAALSRSKESGPLANNDNDF